MQQIEIDFDVWKALTVRRLTEQHTYNDVLRSILGLDSIIEPEDDRAGASALDKLPSLEFRGFYSRGVQLPNGTLLRCSYKNREYKAEIRDGKWLDEQGNAHSSASAAASAITGTNVNGLRFWEARRPNDFSWMRLELLRQQS